jgi:hypothetical protein
VRSLLELVAMLATIDVLISMLIVGARLWLAARALGCHWTSRGRWSSAR